MMKYGRLFVLILQFAFCTSINGQVAPASTPPAKICRTIIQDKHGNIWIAAFDGVFRYDGNSFTNITAAVSQARFFSLLEDSKGNIWFGSIGSGVYVYDGKTFKNFTAKDGLVNNEVTNIYEDKKGNIWFGANLGASCYDGKTFRNYKMSGDTMKENQTFNPLQDARPGDVVNEVNSIIEDKAGRLWFGTRGNSFVFDGKTFRTVTHDGSAFKNVRWIIEDRKGNIWLGGPNGLWRYDGSGYTNYTLDFIGYIYEDRKGNIWTSSQTNHGWALSRYDAISLENKKPVPTEIESEYNANKRMIFGIREASDGRIWFGSLDGVYVFDGKNVTDFKGKLPNAN